MSNLPDFWKTSLSRPFDRFDRLFDEWAAWPALRRTEGEMARYGFTPSCEVTEDKSSYLMKFDLPGVPKDQIKIDLHENRLTVSGERKEEKKSDEKHRHVSEVFYGSFSRSFTFPTQVNAETVHANYENGILTITIPKSEGSRARQITIK